MKYVVIQSSNQSSQKTRFILWRLSRVSLLLLLSLIVVGCQQKPDPNDLNLNSTSSPTIKVDQPTQPTMELGFDPNTQELMLIPTSLAEPLSSIAIRLIISPNFVDQQFDMSQPPFNVSETLTNQGWTPVINSSTRSPNNEVWMDLALINTQPNGLKISAQTVIASLNSQVDSNWQERAFSISTDTSVTKIMTKSAQEIDLSFKSISVVND